MTTPTSIILFWVAFVLFIIVLVAQFFFPLNNGILLLGVFFLAWLIIFYIMSLVENVVQSFSSLNLFSSLGMKKVDEKKEEDSTAPPFHEYYYEPPAVTETAEPDGKLKLKIMSRFK